jgi:hypothetical protein
MGWFKKIASVVAPITSPKTYVKAYKDITNATMDDALGFDPNGGGFVDVYNVAGMATTGLPLGSMGSAGVNLSNGNVNGALKQGLNGAMAYGAGQLGNVLGGGQSGNGILNNILGSGQQAQGGTIISPQSPSVNIMQDTPIQKMALLNNQSPLTSRPRKELTDMLLNNLKAKHGGMNG